jgi:hypothetical protein
MHASTFKMTKINYSIIKISNQNVVFQRMFNLTIFFNVNVRSLRKWATTSKGS